jgi:hypothetical protein
MAYIGAVAPGYDPTRASVPQLDAERFNGNASTTAFTLTRQVVSPTDIDVYVENVKQEPTSAYTVSGYTLNFTEAPSSGTNNIYVIYRASATSNYAYVPDGSITYAKLANNIRQFTVDTFTANGTGSTVALTETPASANSLIVSVDGVIQTAPTNYTLSGSTITFTGVPDSGANVVVKHIGFRTTSTVTALQASSVTATELADSSVTNAKIVSVANTKISGNIVSSQIAPSVTLTTPLISGNLNFDSTGTSVIRLPSANTLVFTTSGAEDMRISSTGDVNIGATTNIYGAKLGITSSSAFPLAVITSSIAGLSLSKTTDNAGNQILFTSNNSYNYGVIGVASANGASTGDIYTLGYTPSGGSAATQVARWTSTGLFQFNSGYGSAATAYGCRAWVNFDGTGTVAIRASGNVSSITDNGTGDYTVNFTTAMPDANYSVSGSAMFSSSVNAHLVSYGDVNGAGGTYPTTSAFKLRTIYWGGGTATAQDCTVVVISVFR